MSELGVSFTIGGILAASVTSVTGSTVKHLDRVRKATASTERASGQVAGYRAMRQTLGAATAALRDAERRAADLHRQLASGRGPTDALRKQWKAARAESLRLGEAVRKQRTALVGQQRALKEPSVDVRRLDAEERRLTRTLRDQAAHRDRLAKAMDAHSSARERRERARIDLVEAGALGYAVLRPLQAVVGKAVEFEEKMADIGKVVDFPAPGGLKAMGKDLLALSTRIPVAAAGLADIVAEAGQAGIARGELLRFAEDAAKVAVAFDLTGKESGDAMAGLRTIFRATQDEAMDLAGAYNHLSNKMAARAPDLLDIANRIGSAGVEAGLSGQQLGALGATMLAMKTPAEESSTALKSMLIRLASATGASKAAKKALEDVGLSAERVEAAMGIDAETAIVEVLQAISKSKNVLGTLKDVFGEDHAANIAKLVGGLDTYAQARRLASSEEAKAASVYGEYETRAATTANALQLLSGQANRLATNLGAALLPGLNALLGPIGAVVDVGAALAERFPTVTASVVALTAGLVVGKVAVVAYRYATGLLGEAWGVARIRGTLLRPVLARVNAAMARMPIVGAAAAGGVGKMSRSLRVLRMALISTGVGAVVVGIGMAIEWLVAHWGGVKAFFGGFARGIGGALDALGPFGTMVRTVGGWIGSLFAPVEQTTESWDRWAAAGEAVGKVVKNIAWVIGAVLDPGAAIKSLLERAKEGGAEEAETVPKVGAAAKKVVAAGAAVAGTTFAAAEPTPAGATFGAAQPLDVVAAPAQFGPIPTPAPAPATTSSGGVVVQVTANITVQAPAGASEEEIAREVARQLADQMRRVAVEAGLGESDDA